MARPRILMPDDYSIAEKSRAVRLEREVVDVSDTLAETLEEARKDAERQGYDDGYARAQAEGYQAGWAEATALAEQAQVQFVGRVNELLPGLLADLNQLCDWARLLKREAVLDTAEQLVASGLAQLLQDQPIAWRSYLEALMQGYDVSQVQLSIPRDLVDQTRNLLAEWNSPVAWKESPADSPDVLWLDAPQGGRVGTFRQVVARLRRLIQTQSEDFDESDPSFIS